MNLYLIIVYGLIFFMLSCDNEDTFNVGILLDGCTSNNDTIEYSNLLYNCGDLQFLNDFSNVNPSFNDLSLIDIGIQTWSASGRILDIILYESHQIDSIPPSIGDLDALRLLDLSADSQHPGYLEHIPSEIGNLGNLLELYLNYNNLTSLPESIGNLSNLQELNASYNNLLLIPESIGNLSNLEVLNINDNSLTLIPENLCNLNTDCLISIYNNALCDDFYYSCFEDFINLNWEWQNQTECCNDSYGGCP